MKKTINVMLVDDHAVVRMGFRMLLEATDDIRVVAEAESAEAAYQQISSTQPDVIVMDISLGGTMGVEATRRIVARDKHARVLGLSSHEDPSYVRYMLKAGALGYLSKRTAPDELIHAIRQVNKGACISIVIYPSAWRWKSSTAKKVPSKCSRNESLASLFSSPRVRPSIKSLNF